MKVPMPAAIDFNSNTFDRDANSMRHRELEGAPEDFIEFAAALIAAAVLELVRETKR